MVEFYKAYFQQVGTTRKVDTIASFGIYAKAIPFKMFEEIKDLPSNDWHDEDGIDEYIPPLVLNGGVVVGGGFKRKSYKIETEWAYKGDKFSANTQIKAFIDYLQYGDKRHTPFFSLYDTYNKIGRTKVRFDRLNDNAELVRDDNGDILIFKITFQVNDPVTEITL